MKVYVVESEWTDWDGWSKSSPSTEGTFDSEAKARQHIFDRTGDKNALLYGWVSVTKPSGDHTVWHIKELEVQ